MGEERGQEEGCARGGGVVVQPSEGRGEGLAGLLGGEFGPLEEGDEDEAGLAEAAVQVEPREGMRSGALSSSQSGQES